MSPMFSSPAGQDLARHPVADLEDSVEAGGDSEPQRHVAGPEARTLQRSVAGDRQGSENRAGRRHAVPKPVARSAERQCERRVRNEKSELRELQRTTAASTSPRTNSRPNVACSCAVSRSIIAIARC